MGLLLVACTSLTGCLQLSVKSHAVNKTVIAAGVMNATLDQLVTRLDTQFNAIQTMNATVEIKATTGGEHEGQVNEVPSFPGYIFLRKPQDLRILLLVQVFRSRALDMVSDGKTFKLLVPPKNRAAEGTDAAVEMPEAMKGAASAQTRQAGLETLRPYIIRDALLIPPLQPDELMTLDENSRVMKPAAGKKESIEEPDYDITVLRKRSAQVLEKVRVIHIGRLTLEPYQQDIYDHEGRIVTRVMYGKYEKVGAIEYPTSIFIERPLDEYTLQIDLTKLQLNTKLDDEQFVLTIPEKIPVSKMP